MRNPLIEEIRRARARRSKELARDIDRAFAESDARLLKLGRVVGDVSSGNWHIVFDAAKGIEQLHARRKAAAAARRSRRSKS
jgi:hypothetical protein